MEVRAKELGFPGKDGSVRASLVYQLAQRKQENHSLALDLAEKTEVVQQLEDLLQRAQLELKEQSDARRELQEQLLQEERELAVERSAASTKDQEHEELRKERGVMLEYIQELAEKCSRLEKEMDRTVQGKDTMHEEMQQAIEAGREREAVLQGAAEAAATKADQ